MSETTSRIRKSVLAAIGFLLLDASVAQAQWSELGGTGFGGSFSSTFLGMTSSSGGYYKGVGQADDPVEIPTVRVEPLPPPWQPPPLVPKPSVYYPPLP